MGPATYAKRKIYEKLANMIQNAATDAETYVIQYIRVQNPMVVPY